MARAYYNEIEPYAAAWLRNLIARGLIAPGDVDERDIRDVRPDDLRGYTQCHFFAGIGVWSYALRLAGWPDDQPVWTGSCPCQPFSAAGKGSGFDDERHLWPDWHHLIRVRRPGVVFGEQVASADGLSWLDLVQADLEGEDYACGPVDLCAAGVGAPHIRQRLWWVADTYSEQRDRLRDGRARGGGEPAISGQLGELADANADGRFAPSLAGIHDAEHHAEPCGGSGGMDHAFSDGRGAGRNHDARHVGLISNAARLAGVALGDASGSGLAVGSKQAIEPGTLRFEGSAFGEAEPVRGFWRGADWIWCRDGKFRPVEPGTFPLAHGASARVGRLRAYGNAINAEAASKFIQAYRNLRFSLV
jgi:DNA (cytosine-5)-methyltransferase 1